MPPTATATAPRRRASANAKSRWPYKWAIMPVEEFFVDPSYQRPLTTLVDSIAEDFMPHIFGVVIASDRATAPGERKFLGPDGQPLALIDGQTRWTGATMAGEPEVPALVYTGLTKADEAEIFALIQVKRRNLTSYQRFAAQVAAGLSKFPMQGAIVAVLAQEGFKLGDASSQKQDPTIISAAAALETVWKWGDHKNYAGDGAELLSTTLRVLREGFPNHDRGYNSGAMIRGMGTFLARYKDNRKDNQPGVDLERLVYRMRQTDPGKIAARANMLREATSAGGSSAKYYADSIFQEYSKRR